MEEFGPAEIVVMLIIDDFSWLTPGIRFLKGMPRIGNQNYHLLLVRVAGLQLF